MLLDQFYTKTKQPISSKVVKTEDGQLLMKYGHAFFPLRSIEKSQVSERTKTLLNSYPCWFMKESLIQNQEFLSIAKYIVSADPKEVYVFEQKQQFSHLSQKRKILSSISCINFSCLKVMHIMLTRDTNFQQISWIDAPFLQQLYISTQGSFTSLKPLQKSNFKNLLMVNFRGSGQNEKIDSRMFDLTNLYRVKLPSYRSSDPPKAKIYTPPGTISVCRMDLSNISCLAKLQIQRLTNFHVPHLQMATNQHHHFAPNAQYPWCPQLQFSQSKVYKSLNNRFDNKTVALSIIDYMFGQQVGEEDQVQNRMRANNNNDNPENEVMEEEDYDDGIDSDLDGPREDMMMQMEEDEGENRFNQI